MEHFGMDGWMDGWMKSIKSGVREAGRCRGGRADGEIGRLGRRRKVDARGGAGVGLGERASLWSMVFFLVPLLSAFETIGTNPRFSSLPPDEVWPGSACGAWLRVEGTCMLCSNFRRLNGS